MRAMSRSVLALDASGLAALAGCHLADSPDPVKCDPGTHPSDGHCTVDVVTGVHVTILPADGGMSCSVEPDSIQVVPNGKFEIENTDSVEHEIAGADGQTWATVKPGQLSPLIGITKVGSFAYTVSGCAKGGTVVVE
jgi:hypothetical protein